MTRKPSGTKKTRQRKAYRATFLRRDNWWVAWTDDVPGAVTQGRTLEEARENLKDAIRLMLEPVDLEVLPAGSTRLVYDVIEL